MTADEAKAVIAELGLTEFVAEADVPNLTDEQVDVLRRIFGMRAAVLTPE